MRYGSVCSGIEAASMAWHDLGWEPAFFSEIEDFPRAVLSHHYPDVPLHGDFTTIGADQYGTIDLLVGGTPCQSFSVAGLRKGLDDDRGNLALEFIKLVDRTRPEWVVWENVPGVLSSNDGRDFGSFLGALESIGYGFAYRVLDAQFFGVAQRRRRVFVVASRTSWQRAAAVLFERESLFGDFEKGRKARENASRCVASCLASGKHEVGTLMANAGTKMWLGNQEAFSGDYRIVEPICLAGNTIGRSPNQGGNGNGFDDTGVCYTLTTADRHGVCVTDAKSFAENSRGEVRLESGDGLTCGSLTSGGGKPGQGQKTICHSIIADVTPKVGTEIMGCLRATGGGGIVPPQVQYGSVVRRLTPIECERLQGFPDDFTKVPYRNKNAEECPDGPRYKAIGNSMAVPVMRWIGERIQLVSIIKDIEAVA